MTFRDIDVVPRVHGLAGELSPTGDKSTLRSEIARGANQGDKRIVAGTHALASPQTPRGEPSLRDQLLASQVAPHRVVTVSSAERSTVSQSRVLAGPVSQTTHGTTQLASAALDAQFTPLVPEEPPKKWWQSALNFVSKVSEGAYGLAKGVVKGAVKLGDLVVTEGIPKLFTRELWSSVGSGLSWVKDRLLDPSTWKAAANLTWKGLTLGPRLISYVVTHPVESLKKAGSFLKGMSDGLGLTDIAVGVGRVFQGDLGGAVQAFKGAGKAFAEFTGLADAWGALKHGTLALYYVGTGNNAEAAKHALAAAGHAAMAAMSIGSIAATVATGGAAAGAIVGVMMLRQSLKSAAKQVLKTAAKEFLECAGAEIGKKVAKEVTQKIGAETLQKTATELADNGMKNVIKEVVGEKGLKQLLDPATSAASREVLIDKLSRNLSADTFQSVYKTQASEALDAMLRKAKVSEIVEKHTLELLKGTNRKSARTLANELVESGLVKDKKLAMEMATNMKKALKKDHLGFAPYVEAGKDWRQVYADWRKAGAAKQNAADETMKKVLQEGIVKDLRTQLEKEMQTAFKAQVEKNLRGQLNTPVSKALGEAVERQAKHLGRDVDSLVKEYTEASWKGVRDAMEEVVRNHVKQGLDEAFQKFRGTARKGSAYSAFSQWISSRGKLEGATFAAAGRSVEAENKKDSSTEAETTKPRLEFENRTYVKGTRVIKDTMVRHEGGKWELAAREELGLLEFAADRAVEKLTETLKSFFASKSDLDPKRKAA